MHLATPHLDDDERFHAAVLIYCESILRLHWNERLINKVFGKAMQSHAAGRVAIQHCRALEFGEPPPTTASILAGTPSGRRTVASFLLLLRMVGMLRVGTSEHDGRQRPLIPQPPLMEGLRQWLVHHLRCAHALGLADASDADALAKGLGLSLTHVHSVLRDAAQRGYLLVGAQRGQGQLSAEFYADYRAWLTTSLSWFAETARLARAAQPARQGQTR